MVTVRVPASSANMGPGFDCLGVALSMYNTARFELTDAPTEIIIKDGADFIPKGENNHVYAGFKKVFDTAGQTFAGVRIELWSDIPVTRGLGSSSSSFVLGLMGANRILNDRFKKDELLHMAYELEGHPDNVAPALMGGFTVSVPDVGKIVYTKTEVSKDIRFAAMIPDFYFQTKKSRGILPAAVSFRSAAFNLSHSALVASAFAKGDYSLLRYAVKDRMHQHLRFGRIRSGEYIMRTLRRSGAICSYLSGAGPTVMSIVDKDFERFEQKMNYIIKTNLKNWRLVMLTADNEGAIYL